MDELSEISGDIKVIRVEIQGMNEKFSKLNGSVADTKERLANLEKEYEGSKVEMKTLKAVLVRVFAPLLVGIIISLLKIFFS